MTRIHDLLQLPESVRKGDFVQSLSGGIDDPDATVSNYAITPAILATFEHALSLIDSALKTGVSQAAYLHGSFGSGKSHFMAFLHLMLSNHKAPWERGELHPLKLKFDWIGNKKLLQLPMHFLGANSIEDKVFETYVRWVAENYPEADFPALYADKELFENAATQRATMGDEVFFEKLNENLQGTSGWGQLATSVPWDGPRFDAVVASDDEKERGRLFSALVKTHFPAFAGQTSRFIDLDRGLQVLARHAEGLGYDSVVLYLDELILWLASNASDLIFIQREVQKLVKLKEAQNDVRAVPIISFIARQRDLAQLVGEQAQGSERAALEDTFKHHTGRFEEVRMADTNLPAIVEHRVLRPKDQNAKATLENGFANAWAKAGTARSTLIGNVGSEEAFRKVFPFSPALVEALVALSDCLQRERTAIRILMELLVEHLPELELGPIVPVGDAYDVIAGGEDPFDQVMRTRFDRARHVYGESFLPMIQADHDTGTAEKCQRLREDHPKKLGCSGCSETACRNDNRLAKTLLMAALVPGAEPFKGLTVKRLVQLNHGTIASPIPGAEVQMAAEKVRRWSAHVGALRVGEQSDPELMLGLEGVELGPIIDKAREYDTPGARKQKVRTLLFTELELPPDGTAVDHGHTYHGIKRKGMVRFGNVREMSESQLRCPHGYEWYLAIDFPFDQAGFSPDDDLQRVEDFRQSSGDRDEPTLVWLPTFFSHELEQTLGDLVVIDHILDGRIEDYLGDLRPEDRIQAQGDLRSLRDQKKDQIVRALGGAYGLTVNQSSAALDPSRSVDEHIVPLSPSLQIGALLAGSLRNGMEQMIDRLLQHRYPHHPKFKAPVTIGKLDRVRILLERLIESQDRRIAVTAADRKDLLAYSDPLGMTTTTDDRAVFEERPLSDLDQRRNQAALQAPSVSDIRGYTDPDGYRGLTPEVQDLLVWCYALWSGRSVIHSGREVQLTKLGQLPEEAELIRPNLPSETEWQRALELGAELFGVTFSNKHLSARNLSSFCSRMSESAAGARGAEGLAQALAGRLDDWGNQNTAPRLTTAQSASALISLIDQSDGEKLVARLAAFTPETSAAALSKSLTTAADVVNALRSESRWLNFQMVRGLLSSPEKKPRAQAILDDLAVALQSDELNEPLSAALAELTARAADLIKPREPSGWTKAHDETVTINDVTKYKEAAAELASRVAKKAAEAEDDVEMKLEVTAVLLSRQKGEE